MLIAFLKRIAPVVALAITSLSSLSAHEYSLWAPGLLDSVALDSRLNNLAAASIDVSEIAIAPTGDWVIITRASEVASAVYFSVSFNSLVLSQIFTFVSQGKNIDVVAFAPNGSYVVVAEDVYFAHPGLPDVALLQAQIQGRIGANQRLTDIAFTQNGIGWSLVAGNYVFENNVPQAFFDAVVDRTDSKRTIQGVAFGSSDRWAVYADQWVATRSIDNALRDATRSWQAGRLRLDHLKMGPGNSHILYSHGLKSVSPTNPIERIEYGLQAGFKNIFQRMQEASIVGLSFAVIDGNQVVYARGYGELENGSQRTVLASSPFDTASLSKYMAALGIMRLAQEGVLTLSTDAFQLAQQPSAANPLYIWKSFAEASPQVFGNPPVPLPSGLTIRRLLSHSASLEPWGSPGFLVSNWPNTDPTLFQLLLGLGCGSGGC